MNKATKRSILRVIHLVFTIPVLGYIYEPISEVGQYAGNVRYMIVPVLILSGYWMYSGLLFAAISVAAWLAVYHLAGFGPALLSQIVLFIARKIWFIMQARRLKANRPVPSAQPGAPANGD